MKKTLTLLSLGLIALGTTVLGSTTVESNTYSGNIWTWVGSNSNNFHNGGWTESTYTSGDYTYGDLHTNWDTGSNNIKSLFGNNNLSEFNTIRFVASGTTLTTGSTESTVSSTNKTPLVSFTPTNIGGLIIETGATGFGLNPSSTRILTLGKTTQTVPVAFTINESFAIGTSSARWSDISLNVNQEWFVASGKTLTIYTTNFTAADNTKITKTGTGAIVVNSTGINNTAHWVFEGSSIENDLNLNNYKGATVEFSSAYGSAGATGGQGFFVKGSYTFSQNIIFTGSNADGTGDALTINNGYSGSVYTFSGSLTGAGTFKKTGGPTDNYIFTGDLSNFQGGFNFTGGASLKLGNGGAYSAINGQIGTGDTSNIFNTKSNIEINYSNDTNLLATITGTGALIKKGAGSLTISSSVNKTAGIQIEQGRVILSEAGSLGNGAIVNNSSFEIAKTSATTIGNVISGSGSVIKSQTGIVTLSGNNTFTGDLIVESGSLIITGTTVQQNTILKGNSILSIGSNSALGNNAVINFEESATISGYNNFNSISISSINVSIGAQASFTDITVTTGSVNLNLSLIDNLNSNLPILSFTNADLNTTLFNITISDTGLTIGETYVFNIIEGNSAVSENWTSDMFVVDNTKWGNVVFDTTTGNLSMQSIPEPSTATLGLLGLGALMLRRQA